ncbi:Hypothetical protein A7982_02221 [Minicystis rosea]|nr:Hypothetical protein A7982_02221 [Minicystis rosea]
MTEALMKIAHALVFAATVIGCGSAGDAGEVGPTGKVVGSTCASTSDCQSQCVQSSHFPGGMCTASCAGDADCPADTACISEDGTGICAVVCASSDDCAAFDRGFTCDDRSRFGASGDAHVCRTP